MIISYLYLKEELSLNFTLEGLIDALNNLGYEVEKVEKVSDIEGIKYGFIESVDKNLNSDNIYICKVRLADRILTIQTSASNVKVGDYVVVFPPGSRGGKKFFEPIKLRGILSEGMLASAKELGFDEKLLPSEFSTGILRFKEANLNNSPIDELKINDHLLTITILSNRPDASSYTVLLAELSAYFGINKHQIFNEGVFLDGKQNNGPNPVTIRFSYKDFQPTIEETFFVARHRLDASLPHHLLSSLLLLKFGIWTQIFNDFKEDRISFDKVSFNGKLVDAIVSKGRLILYSGLSVERTLLPDDNSDRVILLIPRFDPRSVRDNLKIFGKDSPVSLQILRQQKLPLLSQLIDFIKERIGFESEQFKLEDKTVREIAISDSFIDTITGLKGALMSENGRETIKKMMQVGYTFKDNKIFVPHYRDDIKSLQDFVGDYMRYFGYKNLVLNPPRISPLFIQPLDTLRERVVSMGYQEVLTFTLTSKENNRFNPLNLVNQERLKTIVSTEREEIRVSIFNTMIEVIRHNLKNKITPLKFFDIGMISGERQAILLFSDRFSFNSLKEDIVRLFPRRKFVFKRVEEDNIFLVSNLSAYIYEADEVVGWIGRIHPSFLMEDVFAVEVILSTDNNSQDAKEPIFFKHYNKQSLKRRSLTLIRDKGEDLGGIISELRSVEGVFSVELKDIYESNEKQNVTFSILIEEGFERAFEERYY